MTDPLLELRDALVGAVSLTEPQLAVVLLRDDLKAVALGGSASLRWVDRWLPAGALAEIYEALPVIEAESDRPALRSFLEALREAVSP